MAKMQVSFDTPVSELIRRRASWRTYIDKQLEDEKKHLLRTFIDGLEPPPFASRLRLTVMDNPAGKGGVKGTYGIIRGASTFLVGVVPEGPRAMDDFGYVFEAVILRATDLGLGTCWMGGTFNRTAFGAQVGLNPGEVVPAISPLGYCAERRSAVDALFRLGAGSRKRKSWQELFFEHTFGAPLDQAAAGVFREPLEMVRLAPSAANKQPWRVIVEGDTMHFLLQRTPGYTALWAIDMQHIDMGIAMCHFALSAQAAGLKGRWEARAPGLRLPERCEYSISWVREG